MNFLTSRFAIKIFLSTIFFVGVLTVTVYINQKQDALDKYTSDISCIIPGQNIDVQCLSQEIDSLIATQGADVAMERLAEATRMDDQFASSCHGFAHRIGQETFRAFAQGKDIAISPKITYCTYGFYHGFMEAAAQLNGDYKKIAEFCAIIDDKLRPTGLDTSAECYHGIGHGAVEEHDIQEKTDAVLLSRQSLRLCEESAKTDNQKINCASGVFNGIANAYIAGQYGLSANQKTPAEFCNSQPSYAREVCYAFMARVYLSLANGNFSEAIAQAKQTANQDVMPSIISNAAVIYAGRYLRENLDPVVSSCHSINHAWRDACIKGMVIGLVQSSPPEQEFQNAIRLCRLPSIFGEEKEICMRELFTELKKMYPHESFQALCQTSNPDERAICSSVLRQ